MEHPVDPPGIGLQIGMAAALRFKRDGHSMLLEWQRTAHWQRRCKAVLQQAAGRLKNRSLSLAMQEWQYQTWKAVALRRAAQLVQKHSMVAAFNTWKVYHELHLLERALAKFTQLSTSKALASWKEFVALAKDKRAKVQKASQACFASSLQRAWATWQATVHRNKLLRKALESRQAGLVRSYLQHWQQAAQQRRKHSVTAHTLSHNSVVGQTQRLLQHWHATFKAVRCFKRLYCSRAFQAWADKTAHKQDMRQKLMTVSQLLMHGSLARCFQAWQQDTQASVLKRKAFARKQHAIRDAVRIGDQIIRRKRRMLLAGTFNAWRLRAGVYRQVARRFQASLHLTLRWAWTQWKAQLATQALERQWEAQSVDFASYWMVKRLFWKWRQVQSQQATATTAKLTAAAAFAFQTTSGTVFTRWQQFVQLQRERRRRLQAAFVSVMEADVSSRLRLCFERWQNYQRQGQLLSAKSDVVLQLSQRRILQDMFSTWAAYTSAMKADMQPESPFMSPRSSKLNRTLVRRMAAMSGSVMVDPGSDDETDLYNNLYVSPSMVNAEDRLEHLSPFVSLSKNLRRTHTPPTFDNYSDAEDSSFDAHPVADSIHQARVQQYMDVAGSVSSQSPRS
ncbi:hypothetical protein ABBQ38_000907 [Trebouxia sp. C0009 RCD-2024]